MKSTVVVCAAVLITVAACLPAQSTGVLRVVVTDPNAQRVPRARVRLMPGNRVAVTDGRGESEFTALAPGTYGVVALSEGFEPASLEGIRVEAGSEVVASVRLQALRAIHLQVDVIGTDTDVQLQEVPGSAYLVQPKDLKESAPADANEVLRQVPGINLREDSGPVGMRLNIGMRGLNPDRSRTLLVLEDGLPVALAPYGEPEMYYSPPIDRMSRIEILKGSGSILHGPQTIGGVLNFITPDPPMKPQGTLELSGGAFGSFKAQASYGGSYKGLGWYVNGLRKQGDGWRGFYFDIDDFTSKFNLALGERHRLGLKLGLYDEKSNSTYLGLTGPMYRTDPGQNPVPDDLLRVRRYSGSLLHHYIPSPRAVVSTGVFAYTTARNWRRQDFDRAPRAGVKYRGIAGDESVPGGAIYLRDSAGNNNREFDVAGVESRLSLEHGLFGIRQRLETGLRYVRERHRDSRVDGSTYLALSGTVRENEIRDGSAVSGFLQSRLYPASRLTITPGLRVESYDYTRHILRQPVDGIPADVNIRRGDSVMKPIPGLGISYQAFSPLTLFAGVHRGFAPPRVKDAITRAGVSLGLDAELSWNYEAGARLRPLRGLRAEVTWFKTDFQNQIIPAAVSGGATTTLVNGGRTLHRGVEVLIGADWDQLLGKRTGLWSEVRHTWLPEARFTSGLNAGFRLPYAPENAFGLRAGWRHRRDLTVHIDGTRSGGQFADNRQTVAASADGTNGYLPPYWVWNGAAGYEIHRERMTLNPFFTVKNFADAIYISSRAPLGIQPGMFRQILGGMRFRF